MKLTTAAINYLSNLTTAEVDNKDTSIRKLLTINLVSDAKKLMRMTQEEYDEILRDDIRELLS